jgi:hypothetical protein
MADVVMPAVVLALAAVPRIRVELHALLTAALEAFLALALAAVALRMLGAALVLALDPALGAAAGRRDPGAKDLTGACEQRQPGDAAEPFQGSAARDRSRRQLARQRIETSL